MGGYRPPIDTSRGSPPRPPGPLPEPRLRASAPASAESSLVGCAANGSCEASDLSPVSGAGGTRRCGWPRPKMPSKDPLSCKAWSTIIRTPPGIVARAPPTWTTSVTAIAYARAQTQRTPRRHATRQSEPVRHSDQQECPLSQAHTDGQTNAPTVARGWERHWQRGLRTYSGTAVPKSDMLPLRQRRQV